MRWNARLVPRASVAPRVYPLERRTGAADAAEDDERVLRHGLPPELRAGLEPGGGVDEEVVSVLRDRELASLELAGEVARLRAEVEPQAGEEALVLLG